jgi:hypothetical protein
LSIKKRRREEEKKRGTEEKRKRRREDEKKKTEYKNITPSPLLHDAIPNRALAARPATPAVPANSSRCRAAYNNSDITGTSEN